MNKISGSETVKWTNILQAYHVAALKSVYFISSLTQSRYVKLESVNWCPYHINMVQSIRYLHKVADNGVLT